MTDLFADAPEQVSLAQMIKEAERELHFRLSIYPRRVSAGKMSQAQADRQILTQRAIIETLREVQADARLR